MTGYVGRDSLYEEPLANKSAMWADLYALTMSQALFFEGRHEQMATFQAFVRKNPFGGAYLLTAGQNIIHEWLDKHWKFGERGLARLEAKTIIDPYTHKEHKVFRSEFLDMLEKAKLQISLEAMPEGELAFPGEPVFKVMGPIWQDLMIEGATLNTMNSQSNYATYASMLKTIAHGKPIIEFGLRRSQDVGGLSPTRGAYVGGADGTSNCLAEEYYGIKTVGTMAHAYVMVHEDEMDAFGQWAENNPHLGVFLVDTYNTVEGVKRAIEVCKQKGTKLSGIRLDSGDLNYLSTEARKLMDEAGFNEAKILVSNDLDRATVNSLEQQGAPINVYCVGTNLATLKEQPALGGVYKVANIYDQSLTHGEIMAMKRAVQSGTVLPGDIRSQVRDLMKLSNEFAKMTFPGELDVIRYLKNRDGKLMIDGDTICASWSKDVLAFNDAADPTSGYLTQNVMSVLRSNHIKSKIFEKGTQAYRPLRQVFENGVLVGDIETVHIARERSVKMLGMLDDSHKRLEHPHEYVSGVTEELLRRQEAMGRRLLLSGNTIEANMV